MATLRGPGKAGINEVSWNMHYTGVQLPKAMRPPREHESHQPRGPLALPGTYQAAVKVEGHGANETLQVTPDPRVNTPMSVQQATFASAMKLRDEAAADVAVMGRTHAMLQALDKLLASESSAGAGSARTNLHESAQALQTQLGDFAKNFYDPNVQYKAPEDDIHAIAPYGMSLLGLYGNVSGMAPSQAPNAEQRQYIAQMESRLQPLLDEFNGPVRQAVEKFNAQAKQAGVQPLQIGEPVKVGDPRLLANP